MGKGGRALDFISEDGQFRKGGTYMKQHAARLFLLGNSEVVVHSEYLANRPLPEALLFTILNSY